MRINIDGGSVLAGAIVLGTAAIVYHFYKKEAKIATEKKEKLETYKKSVLKDRDLEEEMEAYSVGNTCINSSEDRALAYSVLRDDYDEMQKAKTPSAFKIELNNFDRHKGYLTRDDKEAVNAVLCVWRNEKKAKEEKKKTEMMQQENQKQRSTDRYNARTIADAIKTIKHAQDQFGIELSFN